MKVEAASSCPCPTFIPNVTASQRAIEISKMAAKIILAVGISLVAACFVGIWALPLDLVIYSGAIKALVIPASILALPVVLTGWAVADAISRRFFKKACKAYQSALLANLLTTKEVSNEMITRYREASKDVKKLDLTVSNVTITKEKLDLILDASPGIKKMKLDAECIPEKTLPQISEKLNNIKKITIYHPEHLTEWGPYNQEPYKITHSAPEVKIIKYFHHYTRDYSWSNDYDYSSFVDTSYYDSTYNNDISFAFEWR